MAEPDSNPDQEEKSDSSHEILLVTHLEWTVKEKTYIEWVLLLGEHRNPRSEYSSPAA